MAKFTIGSPSDPTVMKEEITLTVEGRDYLLCFDMAAIATVSKETGINLLAVVVEEQDATTLPALLYASAVKAQPYLTLEIVRGWLKSANAAAVAYKAVLAAWFASTQTDEQQLQEQSGNTQGQPELPPTA